MRSNWKVVGEVTDEGRSPLSLFGVSAVRRSELGRVLEERESPLLEHPGGRFELDGLTPGLWEIAPFAPRHQLLTSQRVAEVDTRIVDFRLMPWGRVSGVVFDPSGAPASHAEISVYSSVIAHTDEFGRFAFAQPPGEALVRAQLIGFCSSELAAIHVSRDEEHDDVRLVLRRPADVRVRVSDPGGAPLAGWNVQFSRRLGRGAIPSAQTDAFGEARVLLTDVDETVLIVSDLGNEPHWRLFVQPECDRVLEREFTCSPEPQVHLRGRIDPEWLRKELEFHSVDPQVAGSLQVFADFYGRDDRPRRSMQSAVEAGRFELELPWAGDWRFRLLWFVKDRPIAGSPGGVSHGREVFLGKMQLDVPEQAVFELDWRE